jgi:hypothetical protein
MKQKDIAIIAVVVIVSVVLAAVTSKLVFKSESHQQKAEVVLPISADFPPPDPRFFNKNSVDATQPIQIGQNGNSAPFTGNLTQ